jgi:hypothetical protein
VPLFSAEARREVVVVGLDQGVGKTAIHDARRLLFGGADQLVDLRHVIRDAPLLLG